MLLVNRRLYRLAFICFIAVMIVTGCGGSEAGELAQIEGGKEFEVLLANELGVSSQQLEEAVENSIAELAHEAVVTNNLDPALQENIQDDYSSMKIGDLAFYDHTASALAAQMDLSGQDFQSAYNRALVTALSLEVDAGRLTAEDALVVTGLIGLAEHIDYLEVGSSVTGISSADYADALSQGMNMPEIAEQQGIDPQELDERSREAINAWLDSGVESGWLTEEQQQVIQTLPNCEFESDVSIIEIPEDIGYPFTSIPGCLPSVSPGRVPGDDHYEGEGGGDSTGSTLPQVGSSPGGSVARSDVLTHPLPHLCIGPGISSNEWFPTNSVKLKEAKGSYISVTNLTLSTSSIVSVSFWDGIHCVLLKTDILPGQSVGYYGSFTRYSVDVPAAGGVTFKVYSTVPIQTPN